MDTSMKTRVLTVCFCAGSGEEGVMEDIERDKCVHNGAHERKQEYILTKNCYGEECVMEDDNCVCIIIKRWTNV